MSHYVSDFTDLAGWLVYDNWAWSANQAGDCAAFLRGGLDGIFALLLVMIYIVAMLRSLPECRTGEGLSGGQAQRVGLFTGSGFGATPPFCPVRGIPCSWALPRPVSLKGLPWPSSSPPLINEVAVLLLVSLLGWKFTLIYVVVGMAVGMLGRAFWTR